MCMHHELEGISTHQLLGSILEVSNSLGLGLAWKFASFLFLFWGVFFFFGICSKFPDDANATSPGTTLWESLLQAQTTKAPYACKAPVTRRMQSISVETPGPVTVTPFLLLQLSFNCCCYYIFWKAPMLFEGPMPWSVSQWGSRMPFQNHLWFLNPSVHQFPIFLKVPTAPPRHLFLSESLS